MNVLAVRGRGRRDDAEDVVDSKWAVGTLADSEYDGRAAKCAACLHDDSRHVIGIECVYRLLEIRQCAMIEVGEMALPHAPHNRRTRERIQSPLKSADQRASSLKCAWGRLRIRYCVTQ